MSCDLDSEQCKAELEKLERQKKIIENGKRKNTPSKNDLIELCKENGLKYTGSKLELITILISSYGNIIDHMIENKPKNTVGHKTICKSKNETNAKILENKIVDDFTNKIGLYNSINKQFKLRYNKEIKEIIRIGEKKHFDLLIKCTDSSVFQCEVKSSCTKDVNTWVNPWDGSVQFLNGTGDSFRIRKFYAKEWYKIMPLLKIKFNINSDIPDFNNWFKIDANIGKPKTSMGLELYNMYDENKKMLRQFKTDFVKKLHVPKNIIDELIEDYVRESKKVLDHKDCWLCICGNNVKLFPKIYSENIKTITRVNSSRDLYYNIDSNVFKGIRVRWQNGGGIANISVQCT